MLAFCMFSTGASGLVNEYILATMTTYILGNSIEQFSIIIALMMLMMGLAGLVQTKMSDSGLMQKFMLIEVAMAMIGAFSPLVIYAAYAYTNDNFLFIHYFFVLSVGFLIGFEIPVVMRIIENNQVRLKSNLAIVYAMDYIGAFVGAIIWVKVLLKNYPLTEISFIVAGFNFTVALLTVLYFISTGAIKQRIVSLVLVSITACFLVIGFVQNRPLSDLLEQKFYDDLIVYKETTKYQHLVITENKQINDVRLYINGNTQFSSLDEARYHELLVHPLMSLKPDAQHVLILGGGDGLALRELLKYKEIKSLTVVDLDPQMVKLASTNEYLTRLNKNAFKDARVHTESPPGISYDGTTGIYLNNEGSIDNEDQLVGSVAVYNIDADQFINIRHDIKWDAVLIDLPDPSSIELSKLYSKQFYSKLKHSITMNSMVAIQSTSPYHAKEAFLTIGKTMTASGFKVLPYRQNIPSFGDWGFFLAWKNTQTENEIKEALKAVTQFNVETDFLTPEVMIASFVFGKGELVSKNECVNTIMYPCLLTQYMDYSWQVN